MNTTSINLADLIKPAFDENGKANYLDAKGEFIEGIYSGLSNKQYHALPALSSSGLKTFAKSPAHYYRTYLSGIDRKRTLVQERTFTTGDVAHRLVLEPNGFYDEFACELNPLDYTNTLRTIDDLSKKCCELGLAKSGSKAVLTRRLLDHDPELEFVIWDCITQNHTNKNISKEMVDPIVWDDAHRCQKTVQEHSYASACFTDGYPELTVLARCQNTGLWIKARPDWLKNNLSVSDYKTTRDASERGFAKQSSDLNYPLQQEFYIYALTLVGVAPTGFDFVANEYALADIVECYALDEEWCIDAQEEMFALLQEFDKCQTLGKWHGYDIHESLKVIREPWRNKKRTIAV